MALNKKRNEIADKWVREQMPNIFISVDDRYKDCAFKEKWNLIKK